MPLLAVGSTAGVTEAAEVVVVCPDAWTGQLTSWKKHRAEQGIQCKVVSPGSSANETLLTIREAATDNTQYVMIVGDAPAIGSLTDVTRQVPIHHQRTTVTAAWNSTPTLSTDLPYGDLDGDGVTDAAVGRLPVDDAQQLSDALSKIIQHETSEDFGDWRNRVSLVGGVGGFGPLIDAAIESVTRTIITGVLPADAKTHVRFGSPGHAFYPKGIPFTQAILNDYADGSRFWVYAGHGQVTELDRVPQTAAGIPVLDGESTKRLAARDGRFPIALMLACYTGAMDAREDSIAEKMWLQRGGPIAVIAGSRVTMPYGNTSAAIGLIDAVYDQKQPRLGDAWLSSVRAMQEKPVQEKPVQKKEKTAQQDHADNSEASAAMNQNGPNIQTLITTLAMLASPAGSDLVAERLEHAKLYNLIGDPTLAMTHPETIALSVKPGFDQATPIELELQSPIDGLMTISLDRPLGTATDGDPNELTIASLSMDVVAGNPIRPSILPPTGTVGPIVLRIHVAGQGCWAAGAAKTRVR